MASGTATQQDWRHCEGQMVAGKFRLDQYVGASDHSGVFVTERSGEKAAIKLFPAERINGDAQMVRWRAASTLSHPNLLRVYEFGKCQLDGRAFVYVVTQFAEENLSQVVPLRALSPDEAKAVLQATVSVLEYIHLQGLVHGRIKPSNILAIDDELKISSDSIGRAEATGWGERDVYGAPEYGTGMSSAADVWSLGMTLSEVMTQKLPAMKGGSDPSAPSTLPQPFFDIVRHSIRRDPKQRWTLPQVRAALTPAPETKAKDVKRQEIRPQVKEAPAAKETRHEAKPEPSTGEAKSPYLLPGIGLAVIVLLAVLLAVFHRSGSTPPANEEAVSTAAPVVPAQPKPNAAVGETNRAPSSPAPQQGDGKVRERITPAASPNALRTITGHLRVAIKVDVDSAGNVTDASFATRGPSEYFARVSMDAARKWKFIAPVVDGKAVASRWLIKFKFSRKAIDDSLEQLKR